MSDYSFMLAQCLRPEPINMSHSVNATHYSLFICWSVYANVLTTWPRWLASLAWVESLDQKIDNAKWERGHTTTFRWNTESSCGFNHRHPLIYFPCISYQDLQVVSVEPKLFFNRSLGKTFAVCKSLPVSGNHWKYVLFPDMIWLLFTHCCKNVKYSQ